MLLFTIEQRLLKKDIFSKITLDPPILTVSAKKYFNVYIKFT